jgi:molecular chaperone IbpA
MTRLHPLSGRYLGFENLFSDLERLLETGAQDLSAATGFPPYNLYRDENGYTIELAVAGFTKEHITLEHDTRAGVLHIRGDNRTKERPEGFELIRQGIAARSFVRSFNLSPEMEVGTATVQDGMLHVRINKVEQQSTPVKLIPIS